MMDFFFPIPEHFCPLFAHRRTNCPDGVFFCPDGVSFRPDFHPQPLFFTLPSHTPFGDMYVHKTPPHPTPKHPFSKTAPRPAPPRPAPPRARPRRFPPAGVVLSVEKCAPSGPLPPAERTRESGVNAAAYAAACMNAAACMRCCNRKMRRHARRQHQSGGVRAA